MALCQILTCVLLKCLISPPLDNTTANSSFSNILLLLTYKIYPSPKGVVTGTGYGANVTKPKILIIFYPPNFLFEDSRLNFLLKKIMFGNFVATNSYFLWELLCLAVQQNSYYSASLFVFCSDKSCFSVRGSFSPIFVSDFEYL